MGGYSHTFGYDHASNPTTFKGASQTFNWDNQRTASGYAYDGNGNPTSYAGNSCTYDAESRLTSFGGISSYGYRADGLRAWKQVGSERTYFLYDGGNPVIEMDKTGATTAINDFGPDGLTARKVGNSWTYYVFDWQGSVAQRLNSAGGIIGHNTYDAYGEEWSTGNPSDPWGYNAKHGYYFDRDTGKYYCQNRYYDPAQGRWLNRDPIGYAGGMNLYGYCGQGPVGSIDPQGYGKLKIFKIIFENGKKIQKEIMSIVEAKNARGKGKNILVEGNNADEVNRVAKEIEDSVPGKTRYDSSTDHPQKGQPNYSHYQTEGKPGHSFMNVRGIAIPFADFGDRVGGPLGECINFFNPLSDLQDILQIISIGGGPPNPETPWHSIHRENGYPYPNSRKPGRSPTNPIVY